MADALPQQEKVRWPGFKYMPVPARMNRHISRYLRGQRKNMRRFFTERGFWHLAVRLDEIRKDSAGSMMEKNRKFQEILNDYAKAMAPPGATTVPTPGPETNTPKDEGSAALDVRAGGDGAGGSREDDGGSVPIVEE
jgi:hypothetical protein